MRQPLLFQRGWQAVISASQDIRDRCKAVDSVKTDNVALLVKPVVEFLYFVDCAKYRVEVTQER